MLDSLINVGMIESMHRDFVRFQTPLGMYSKGYVWKRWIRSII